MDGRQRDLEMVFGSGGIWQRMLLDADGYLGTELWCESIESRAYRVRDLWSWHRDFEKFRAQSQAELEVVRKLDGF